MRALFVCLKQIGSLHLQSYYRACRQALRQRHIRGRIARKGRESRQRLGRHRRVVERTFAWLNRFRRLTIRYERRRDIHEAITILGCALICWKRLAQVMQL